MKQEKCPKCGFILTDNNYCIKCGYQKNITIQDLNFNNESQSELELVLGSDYHKILHNQNSVLIFLLGPLYIFYRNFFVTGTFLYIIDVASRVYISVVLNETLDKYKLGVPHEPDFVIIFWLIVRLLYVIFGDSIIILLSKIKLSFYKKIFKNNYKYILSNTLPKIITIIIIIIFFILQIIFWEYKFLLGI